FTAPFFDRLFIHIPGFSARFACFSPSVYSTTSSAAVILGMSISGDTLIRAIRESPELECASRRVVGIDDWAKRKGQNYATILVDLETHQPLDLLDSRTTEAVSAWFREHPGVEVVSRDRAGDYSKGVSDGAPSAEQVADRWHLLSNLRDALVV